MDVVWNFYFGEMGCVCVVVSGFGVGLYEGGIWWR